MSRVQVPLSLLPLRVRKALILLAFRTLCIAIFKEYIQNQLKEDLEYDQIKTFDKKLNKLLGK